MDTGKQAATPAFSGEPDAGANELQPQAGAGESAAALSPAQGPDGSPEELSGEGGFEAQLAALQAASSAQLAESAAQLAGLQAENAAQLAAFCTLARSLPGLVPELVAGATLDEVQTSLTAAREAYSRVAANLAAGLSETGRGPGMGPGPGAGGGARQGPDGSEDRPARLSSERGINLIYQALAGGKAGNLAR
jgi:hypothetical protein